MIAGEHQNLDMVETRRAPPLPQAEPRHTLLETSEAARRLGQRRFTAGDRGGRYLIEKNKSRTDFVEWQQEMPFMDIDVREDYERLKELA